MDVALTIARRTVSLIWLALVVALVALIVVSNAAPHIGQTVMIVRGGSMEPALPLGSLAVATAVDPRDVVVGDIISFRTARGILTTHRVSGIVDEAGMLHFVTHGDANASPDGGLVQASQVVGVVKSHVPYLGYVQFYLSTAPGIVSAVSALGAMLMLMWMLGDAQVALRDRRAGARVPQPTRAFAGDGGVRPR